MPTNEDMAEVLDFYGEFKSRGEACIGYNGFENFPAWLEGMQNRHTGTNLPKGYVRENFYLCRSGGELVGVFSLKFELTEFLLNYGGHIGYAVRPSRQNRGLATKILEHGLDIARQHGFERVLCVCDEDNIASEKVISKNGGVFENKLYDSDEGVFVKRYWIEL